MYKGFYEILWNIYVVCWLTPSVGKAVWKGSLFDKLVEGLSSFTKEKNIEISGESAIRALIEIYCYCHKKNLEKVDSNFIELFFENYLKKYLGES